MEDALFITKAALAGTGIILLVIATELQIGSGYLRTFGALLRRLAFFSFGVLVAFASVVQIRQGVSWQTSNSVALFAATMLNLAMGVTIWEEVRRRVALRSARVMVPSQARATGRSRVLISGAGFAPPTQTRRIS